MPSRPTANFPAILTSGAPALYYHALLLFFAEIVMRRLLPFCLMLLLPAAQAQEPPVDDIPPPPMDVPEPPDLPMPVQSGEEMQPDITIIRKGKDTIEEYRRGGKLYMVKVKPQVGPAYYLIDTNGDGRMDVKKNDLDKTSTINQWILFEWD